MLRVAQRERQYFYEYACPLCRETYTLTQRAVKQAISRHVPSRREEMLGSDSYARYVVELRTDGDEESLEVTLKIEEDDPIA